LEPSDSELVAAACNGDIDSFGALYRRYYRMAVGIAYSRLSDHHLAEDAAQEAFAVACRQLATLGRTDQFASWLGTICRRIAGRIKKSRVPCAVIGPNDHRAEAVVQADMSDDVHSALAALPDQAREIVVLHYFSGLSYEQIASALAITLPAVHGRLQRARQQLAERLRLID
jgi:RNA polymerase sigma-70 factor (ECF subfamily)